MNNAISDTVALLIDLVRRDSVTPEDRGCQEMLGARLEKIGFTLESMPANGVSNLWARKGDAAPLLVFAGHTDVVPTGNLEHWSSPPFDAAIIDDHVVGRGAADMKGGVAAMITAIERFVQSGQHTTGSIAILLTSDEEGPATHGTREVIDRLQARSEHIDYCVVGEPTSTDKLGDVIRHGRRGSLGAQVVIKGTQGHVAYPHLADNPIHRAMPAVAELTSIEWDKGNDHFPPTTLQVSNIHAGTGATNVIPGELTIEFNLRYPFITDPGTLTDAMQNAIRQESGITATLDTGGGTSDGRFIAPTGAQVIEFGPINATIHQIDEKVSCTDIDALTRIYESVLQQLLGKQED